jgi:predicted ATPase
VARLFCCRRRQQVSAGSALYASELRSLILNAAHLNLSQEQIRVSRYIITGAPGAGKTAIIRQLELDGFSVVEEAATDVIAGAQAQGKREPWTDASFIDAIVGLQKTRQMRACCQPEDIQFHDRSVVCTAALATYLGYSFPRALSAELERIQRESIFEKRVFFVRNLGFLMPTQARRISFEETLRFEKIHEETYRNFGFELVSVEPGSLLERVSAIKQAVKKKSEGSI